MALKALLTAIAAAAVGVGFIMGRPDKSGDDDEGDCDEP